MHARIALPSLAVFSALAVCTGFALSPGQAKSAPAINPSGGYQVDSVHSTVIFKIKHLNTSWTFGRFDQVSGSFSLNASAPEKSTVAVEIEAESVDTGQAKRDAHLKSPSFFDAVQFPNISFTSKSVKKAGEGKYTVDGELTLHGIKKPLSVDLEQVGISDTDAGVRAGFFGTFTIKRSDFGMKFMPEGIGDDVQVMVSIEGTKTDAGPK